MIKQSAFFYFYRSLPGLGVLAFHEHEGWHRVNFYSFGVDMDALQKGIENECEEELLREGMLSSRVAETGIIIAGGVVFKGLSCVAGAGAQGSGLLEILEKRVSGFRTVDPRNMVRVDSISPLDINCFTYSGRVIGISRVVFFEYATQVSLVGIYRDRDRKLVDGLYSGLSGLNEYMSIPSPLRTDERDRRAEINMFMIRLPVKEELQADFVQAVMKTSELSFFSA